jgi:ubiquinone/menaquinone biosynthesis C-methylase UbiE
MKWYDVIAPVYDRVIQKSYFTYRQAAVQALHLRPQDTILDIACGTGLNFELIMEIIGAQGTLIGVDSSTEMLNRARSKIQGKKWKNVRLLQRDLQMLKLDDIQAVAGSRVTIDGIICTLGFSVFPDWQAVFENSFSLLKSGGRYCIMDIFNEKVTLRTRLGNIFARSDNSRLIWLPLEKKCLEYKADKYPMAHGYLVVVAVGTKS